MAQGPWNFNGNSADWMDCLNTALQLFGASGAVDDQS